MLKKLAGITTFMILTVAGPAWSDSCTDCHRGTTPAAVSQWQGSVHYPKVGCSDCHGDDHEAMLQGRTPVNAVVCGECHQKAFAEHSHSKHGLGLHSGWGCTRKLEERDPRECRFCHEEGTALPLSTVQCARFLKQSSEMGELGCNRCHQIEASCASCHANHLTDLKIVRDPNVCAKCHMGPDHPQWEMWQTSQHGTIYDALGEDQAPDCQRCHMPSGSHDVSQGIAHTPAGEPVDASLYAARREQMIAVCSDCHARSFVLRDFVRADGVLSQSRALVKEAESVVWDLHDRELLSPMPDQRPAHPLRGETLVTDGQMLYEDISHVERLLFKMKKYDFAKTWKGAYHQNPAYTHWYGNAELKMDLVDIRTETLRLEGTGRDTATTRAEPSLEETLQVLKKKYERGALSEQDYAREKGRLLELEFGRETEK